VHLVLADVSQGHGLQAGVTHAVPVFHEYVVVTADGDEEEHHLHIVEDMYPLLPL